MCWSSTSLGCTSSETYLISWFYAFSASLHFWSYFRIWSIVSILNLRYIFDIYSYYFQSYSSNVVLNLLLCCDSYFNYTVYLSSDKFDWCFCVYCLPDNWILLFCCHIFIVLWSLNLLYSFQLCFCVYCFPDN